VELVEAVLRRCLQSPACSPRQYAHTLLVCSQFCDIGMSPAILRILPPSVLLPRFERWSDSNLHFLRSCAAAGNSEALFILGMTYTYCFNDPNTGSALLTRAARDGHVAALHSLAIFLLNRGNAMPKRSCDDSSRHRDLVTSGNQVAHRHAAEISCRARSETTTETSNNIAMRSRSSDDIAAGSSVTDSIDAGSSISSGSSSSMRGNADDSGASSASSSISNSSCRPTTNPDGANNNSLSRPSSSQAPLPAPARTAVQLLLRAAQGGDIASLVELAHCVQHGVGARSNERMAHLLLARARALQVLRREQGRRGEQRESSQLDRQQQQQQQQQARQQQDQRKRVLCGAWKCALRQTEDGTSQVKPQVPSALPTAQMATTLEAQLRPIPRAAAHEPLIPPAAGHDPPIPPAAQEPITPAAAECAPLTSAAAEPTAQELHISAPPAHAAPAPAAATAWPNHQWLPVPRHPIHSFLLRWRKQDEEVVARAQLQQLQQQQQCSQSMHHQELLLLDSIHETQLQPPLPHTPPTQALHHLLLHQHASALITARQHQQLSQPQACGNRECGWRETSAGSFRRCAGCHVAYCSRSCQLEEWARTRGMVAEMVFPSVGIQN
ncbi:unnamed protein product, partial [Closterium sp. NIES-54]